MAVTSNDPRQPVIITPGGVPRIIFYPEAASQSFKIGQALYLNSGALTVIADGACDTDSVKPVGFAAADASGVTSALCPVLVPDYNSELIVYVTNAGTAALASTLTIGTNYALYVVAATGLAVLDSNVANKDVFQVIGYVYDATGASTYFAKVRPVAAGWGSLAGA